MKIRDAIKSRIDFLNKKTYKVFEGERLPKKDFAYTPSDKVSEWKLPINTPDRARAAAQALSSKGLMGNKVKIPAKDLPSVKRKVDAANRKFKNDIKKSEGEHIVSNETTVDITKSAEFIELQKSLAAMQEQLEATKSQNEILKSKEDARVKAGFETIVKSAGFIGEELESDVVEFLCKSSDETAMLFHNILKSAQEKISAVEAEKEEIKKSFAPEVGFNAPTPDVSDLAKTEASIADFREYVASLSK